MQYWTYIEIRKKKKKKKQGSERADTGRLFSPIAQRLDYLLICFRCFFLDFVLGCTRCATAVFLFQMILKAACNGLNLTQIVTVITRPNKRNPTNSTFIDLILTNRPHKLF